ncbi:hypothetical protein BTE77_35525 [Ensifer adhaerens]|nr:hypothetical protein BTE77_35525 [Ensifer adhaerens]
MMITPLLSHEAQAVPGADGNSRSAIERDLVRNLASARKMVVLLSMSAGHTGVTVDHLWRLYDQAKFYARQGARLIEQLYSGENHDWVDLSRDLREAWSQIATTTLALMTDRLEGTEPHGRA